MGDFSKKLLGIFLGISLSLGVGASLSNSVHHEAVGVEAETQTVSFNDGSNVEDATIKVCDDSIDGVSGKKAGTSKKAGTIILSIPANTIKLNFYAAAWNGNDSTLKIVNGETIVAQGLTLYQDSGIKDNSPFTLSTTTYDKFFFSISISDINKATNFTLSAGVNRFVVWNPTAEIKNENTHTITIKDSLNNDISSSSIVKLEKESTTTLMASCDKNDATTITWSQTDNSIAELNAGDNGLLTVKGLYPGKTVITAKCEGSGEASFTLKVNGIVTDKTIAELANSTADNTRLYEITGYVSGLDKSKQVGVFYLSDAKDESNKLYVYGATSTDSALSESDDDSYKFERKYNFTSNNETKDITDGQRITIRGFTYTYKSMLQFNGVVTNVEPLVQKISISPSTNVVIGVNHSEEYTISITGTYLSGDETVKLSYDEAGEEGSVSFLKSTGEVIDLENDTFKNREKIIVKALKEGGYGQMTIASIEDSSITATSGTIETEPSTPVITSLSISPYITEISDLEVGETREYSVNFEGKYLDDTSTVKVEYADYSDEKAIIILDSEGNETQNNALDVKNGSSFKIKGALISEGELTIKPSTGISLDGCESISISTTTINTIIPTLLEVSGTLAKDEFIIGESFDPDGLTVTASYNNSTKKDVTDKVEWPVDKFSKAGENIITATYKETTYVGEIVLSTSIKVDVIEDYIIDVTFDLTNAKTEYKIGDTFVKSESGVSATATYKVSETPLVLNAEDLTYNCETFTLGGKQTITVSYTVGNNTFKDSYTVNVASQEISSTIKGDEKYHLVTNINELQAGDKFIIASNGKLKALGGYNTSSYFDVEDFVFEENSTNQIITTITDKTTIFTLGGSKDAWTFQNQNDKYVESASKKTMSLSDKSSQTWNISIDSNNDALIKPNITTTLCLFLNDSSSRYTTYDKTAETNNELFPQIYKLEQSTVTTHSCSLALINFVDSIYSGKNPLLSCDPQGINSIIKWEAITEEFNKLSLEVDEIEILKIADSNPNGNDVEKFLYDYDYILVKYSAKGYTDFLDRKPNDNEKSSKINYLSKNNTAPFMTVVIISFAGITAIGGYFFLRKRKIH